MSGDHHIPCGSQTVGPFFRIGLEYLHDRTPSLNIADPGIIELSGRILDRDSQPVPDAVLEFWSSGASSLASNATGFPLGFRRAPTDDNGLFRVRIERPSSVPLAAGDPQAPHLLVLLFSRGLLRHLVTRVYPGGDPSIAADLVLQLVPEPRRHTLIAQPLSEQPDTYLWNVFLQGQNETVFFEW